MAEDFAAFGDLLPEGALPVLGFQVVTYLDAGGSPGMSWERQGEQVTAARALGDIVGAAFEMFHCHLHDETEKS